MNCQAKKWGKLMTQFDAYCGH